MTVLTIKHTFVNTIAEDGGSGGAGQPAGPNEWNANHALTIAGTSGGIPYFDTAASLASSAALTANALVLGGGAGVAPTVVGSLGTTTTVLHGNASGAPTFGAVALTTDVSGTLPVANGGTNAGSASGTALDNITGFASTGYVKRTGAGAYSFITSIANGDLTNSAITVGTTSISLGSSSTTLAGLTSAGFTSSGSINWNSDTTLSRFGVGLFGLSDSTTATGFQVYNTTDSTTSPTNYERGIFDWTTSANVLTIGTQNGGTGTARNLQFVTGGTNRLDFGVSVAGTWTIPTGANSLLLVDQIGDNSAVNKWTISSRGGSHSFNMDPAFTIAWAIAGNGPGGTLGTGLARVTDGVLEINNGTAGTLTGTYLHWGGQARVTSDFNTGNTTVLANITGLSVNVAAGRTYTFEAQLFITDAAAGGVQAAIAGTATATAIQYTGWTVADNAIKAKTNATALATAVGSTVTTETSGIMVQIYGTITVNAAGTLTVQLAQNTGNATGTIAKRGSFFIVHDMP